MGYLVGGGSINQANYQTDADVQTAIDALIDSAPGTLDTLGEIAAALQAEETATGALIAKNTEQDDKLDSLETRLVLIGNNQATNREEITADKVLTNADPGRQNLINLSEQDLTVTLPATPYIDRAFLILNHATSKGILLFEGKVLIPGDRIEAAWDGVEWILS